MVVNEIIRTVVKPADDMAICAVMVIMFVEPVRMWMVTTIVIPPAVYIPPVVLPMMIPMVVFAVVVMFVVISVPGMIWSIASYIFSRPVFITSPIAPGRRVSSVISVHSVYSPLVFCSRTCIYRRIVFCRTSPVGSAVTVVPTDLPLMEPGSLPMSGYWY